MVVFDSRGCVVNKGDIVICEDPIDGVSLGTPYTVLDVQPEASRLVLINDSAREQWLLSRRFRISRLNFRVGDLVRVKLGQLRSGSHYQIREINESTGNVVIEDDSGRTKSFNKENIEKIQLEMELD